MEASTGANAQVPSLPTTNKRTSLPNPKTITVQELQEIIKQTLPPRTNTDKFSSKFSAAPAVGGAQTPWTLVRAPAVPEPMNAFDEVHPNLILGDQ